MSDSIKKIYLGLPEHIASKVLWVERKFRINELSHQPGGYDIVIEYHSGNVFAYDWIKKPSHYAGKILANEALEAGMEFNYGDGGKSFEAASKKFIRSAYCKYYDKEGESEGIPFDMVWDVDNSWGSLVDSVSHFENDISKKFIYKSYPKNETPYYDIALIYNALDNDYMEKEYLYKARSFYEQVMKTEPTSMLADKIRNITKRIREIGVVHPF